ncbi:GNAT family N-acetyltransferase [uncultured Oscillibacter sp.]|uniref:GNAT family N-acetyltransferase n=1 Tax=uncultured Oscillibacter sp. TaxID=876091 RepID=UPI002635818E|nr:GNAT family N-acetyltransferase [uncultured Oscillibacter sp.]
MIRRMGEGDLEAVAAIWLDANREAHDFIPASYWLGHFEEVRTALAQAEVWVFEAEARAEISGFIGLQEDYIAGIFVRREARSGGVGRQLLDHVKAGRRQLRLQVYRKNSRAAGFYRREGFRVLEEGVDPGTGEAELLMEWRRGGPQS